MSKFIFIICGLFVLNVSVFGQNALEKDLDKSFKKYDLVKLDNRDVLEKTKNQKPVNIQAYGRDFEFTLIPNDLRAVNYRAVESTGSGERELRKQSEVTTYKGKLSDDAGSEVRFTITNENIEGFIYTSDNKKFYVTQAVKYSSRAGQSDALVYGEEDFLKNVDLSKDAENLSGGIEGKIDAGLDILNPQIDAATATNDIKAIEVATEADFQWVTQTGSATAANNDILGILNLVDGIYRRDLNLTVKVTYQHAWTTPDPYPSTSTQALLDSFLSYWNANYPPSQYRRQTAHLFTGKFTYQGIAYSGTTCRSPGNAYGLTGRSDGVNHLVTAHEIAHNLGAEHIDDSGSCAKSLMNPFISPGVTAFCEVSKSQVASFVAAFGSCLSSAGTVPTPATTSTRFDFDGDGRADVSVFRPAIGNWYISRSLDNSLYDNRFGQSGDVPTAADFDGDRKTDVAVFRPSNGTWYYINSSSGQFTAKQFGQLGDMPVPGDFDGDGRADISVFRPSNGTWYRTNSSNAQSIQVQFGQIGDIPVIGDFDGDAKSDVAVFRPGSGVWYISKSSNGVFYEASFGQAGDIPTAADFDGDRKTDVAVYRPSTGNWYRLNSSTNSFFTQQFGMPEDKPTAADFDGDGRADLAVFRPSSGSWFIQGSTSGFVGLQFGTTGDVSIPTVSMF